MKIKHLFFFAAIFGLFFVTSCNKDDDDTDTTTADPGDPTPTFSDMDGLLAAIQTITYQDVPVVGEIAVYADVATAAFFNTSSTYDDAGTVSVNTYTLDKLDNNAYALPSVGSSSIDFDFSTSSGNAWDVSGTTAVPAFMHTTTNRMPGDVKFDGDYSTVNTASDLIVSIESAPVNTDSILFVVAFNNTTLTRTVGPTTLSATFPASELSGASGTGVVQAAAYNFEFGTYGGKKHYFINESVVSEVAAFQ